MNTFTLLGLVAATCTTISFIPQAVKVIRTKDTRSLSLPMYALFTIGITLWLVYGLLIKDIPIVAANTVTIALTIIIIVSILRYRRISRD